MNKVIELLGDKSCYYLDHTCKTIDKSLIHIPSPDTIDKIWLDSDRNIKVLNSLQSLLGHGRLANTGYVSILPVDQDIEHTAGASFAPNPIYFDPENIVKLAIEGGCNAVASTFGILGSVARKYAHKIPFVVKLNHNELLSYPNSFDQVLFGTVKEAWNMGAVAVGATIYFGSEQSRRQLVEIAEAFEYAHELGMATILWCYLRNNDFKKGAIDYHSAADLTGQADRLGVTIKADIVKQKLPTNNGGFKAIGFGKVDERMYTELVRFSRRKSILPFVHSHSNTYAVSNDQKFPEHIDLNWRESGKSIKEKFRSLKFFGKRKLFKQDIHHLFPCHIMPLQEFPE